MNEGRDASMVNTDEPKQDDQRRLFKHPEIKAIGLLSMVRGGGGSVADILSPSTKPGPSRR